MLPPNSAARILDPRGALPVAPPALDVRERARLGRVGAKVRLMLYSWRVYL